MREFLLSVAAVLMLASADAGAAAHGPEARERAGDALRDGLFAALRADGRAATKTLQSIDAQALDADQASLRQCVLARLDARRKPDAGADDAFLAALLDAYREYWLRSLRAEGAADENEAWLLDALNAALQSAGAQPGASLDDIEQAIEAAVRARGHHVLLGVTSPLRELMLWRDEAQRRYEVALPEAVQPVTVVLMDGFASLGWAGFATCDRHHTGGWTRPDRLYAVRAAYDLDSEEYRVSYLAHEAQHFLDGRRFPGLEQSRLEYRAKLAELATARDTQLALLEQFSANTSDDPAIPHSHANGRLVRDLARRLFGAPAARAWNDAGHGRVRSAAVALLREDTAALARGAADQ